MKRTRLLRLNAEEKKLSPKPPKFVAEVAITSREDGEVIGTAKVEQLHRHSYITHIDASGMTAEMLRRGFSLGEFSVTEED